MNATATNAEKTKALFAVIPTATMEGILEAIANHYGITRQDAFDEVTDAEAESLLDYLTGSVRTATSVLMQRHGLQ